MMNNFNTSTFDFSTDNSFHNVDMLSFWLSVYGNHSISLQAHPISALPKRNVLTLEEFIPTFPRAKMPFILSIQTWSLLEYCFTGWASQFYSFSTSKMFAICGTGFLGLSRIKNSMAELAKSRKYSAWSWES